MAIEPPETEIITNLPKPLNKLRIISLQTGTEAKIVAKDNEEILRLFFYKEGSEPNEAPVPPEGRMGIDQLFRISKSKIRVTVGQNEPIDLEIIDEGMCRYQFVVYAGQNHMPVQHNGPAVFFLPVKLWEYFFPNNEPNPT